MKSQDTHSGKETPSYVHVTPDILLKVIGDPALRPWTGDDLLLSKYIQDKCPKGRPIYLSYGETWTEVPPELQEHASRPSPSYVHGYIVNEFGLAQLRKVLQAMIKENHRLPPSFELGRDFEVAVACQGTRASMFDFARMVKSETSAKTETRTPVAIAPLPGWDYPGVLESLGYRVRFLPVRRSHDFQPLQEDLERILQEIDSAKNEYLAMMVINPQHNPSGANWGAHEVRTLIQTAIERKAAVLIDDAYYGMHDPEIQPTSALEILAQELGSLPTQKAIKWVAVRSLGKQFHCNGWGIGVITSSPPLLARLMLRYFASRSYMTGIPLQHTMANWLVDPHSTRYLQRKNEEYRDKRRLVVQLFENLLGFPQKAFFVGNCTSYVLFQVPDRYLKQAEETGLNGAQAELRQNAIESYFRDLLFRKTGVLVGLGSLAFSPEIHRYNPPHMRIFLGPQKPAIQEAFQRMQRTGFTWK